MSLWGTSPHLFAHLHLLVTEGGEDYEGRFHHLAEFQDGLIAEFFSRQVFSLLLEEELISEAVVEKIEGWRHSGFSVHSQVRAQTKEEAERVGKYMIRPLLSLERLSFDHLKLTFVAERPPPPHVVSQEFLMDSEAPAEYFP